MRKKHYCYLVLDDFDNLYGAFDKLSLAVDSCSMMHKKTPFVYYHIVYWEDFEC